MKGNLPGLLPTNGKRDGTDSGLPGPEAGEGDFERGMAGSWNGAPAADDLKAGEARGEAKNLENAQERRRTPMNDSLVIARRQEGVSAREVGSDGAALAPTQERSRTHYPRVRSSIPVQARRGAHLDIAPDGRASGGFRGRAYWSKPWPLELVTMKRPEGRAPAGLVLGSARRQCEWEKPLAAQEAVARVRPLFATARQLHRVGGVFLSGSVRVRSSIS